MVITVKAENAARVIVVTDGNENLIQLKDIPVTTLTDGLWKFYLTDNVLLLPSEYWCQLIPSHRKARYFRCLSKFTFRR